MKIRSIINEDKLQITATDGLESVLPQAVKVLHQYLDRYGSDNPDKKSALTRYKFNLDRYNKNYNTFYFSYRPITNRIGVDEVLSPDDKRYEYYTDGKTGYKTFKTPKDAIDSIPANDTYAYRGMSWEEWQKIRTTGLIQSHGSQNFSNQNNLTFFGYEPDTGLIYAGSFAPMAFKPTPKKPGVVIAVPREHLIDHTVNPNVPSGELAHVGPLSAKAIQEIYMIIMTKYRNGKFDLSVDWRGNVIEGSRFDISAGYAIRKIK